MSVTYLIPTIKLWTKKFEEPGRNDALKNVHKEANKLRTLCNGLSIRIPKTPVYVLPDTGIKPDMGAKSAVARILSQVDAFQESLTAFCDTFGFDAREIRNAYEVHCIVMHADVIAESDRGKVLHALLAKHVSNIRAMGNRSITEGLTESQKATRTMLHGLVNALELPNDSAPMRILDSLPNPETYAHLIKWIEKEGPKDV